MLFVKSKKYVRFGLEDYFSETKGLSRISINVYLIHQSFISGKISVPVLERF